MKKIDEKEFIKKQASKRSFFRGYTTNGFFDFVRKIAKLKNQDVQLRTDIFVEKCLEYYNTDEMIDEIKFEMYEKVYENFVNPITKSVDIEKYNNLFAEYKNIITYTHLINCMITINHLLNQGLNINELSNKNANFIKETLKLQENCGINFYENKNKLSANLVFNNVNYSPAEFYLNKYVNNAISHKINWYLKDIEKLTQNKMEQSL